MNVMNATGANYSDRFRELIRSLTGISLPQSKVVMIDQRLRRRVAVKARIVKLNPQRGSTRRQLRQIAGQSAFQKHHLVMVADHPQPCGGGRARPRPAMRTP